MEKGWIAGLCMVTISLALLTMLTVFDMDIARGHSGGGGGSYYPLGSESFKVVLDTHSPFHSVGPSNADWECGHIVTFQESEKIKRQPWIDAFVNRGSTEEERHHRHAVITGQLWYEQEQYDAALMVLAVNAGYYVSMATDFVMDWGTAIAQDVTATPYNEVYDWSKHSTAIGMVAVAKFSDMHARGEYNAQAVDEVVEAVVDVAVGKAVQNMERGTCKAPEIFSELMATGVKGVHYMLERAVPDDQRPGGWGPTAAR
jgi:hypothetical protein